jgi:hypothetical protein
MYNYVVKKDYLQMPRSLPKKLSTPEVALERFFVPTPNPDPNPKDLPTPDPDPI